MSFMTIPMDALFFVTEYIIYIYYMGHIMPYKVEIHDEDNIKTINAKNKDYIIQALADHIRWVLGDEVYIDGEFI